MKKLLFLILLIPLRCEANVFFAYSSSCTNNSSIGTNLWTTPANAQGAPDGSYATESGSSQYLYCSQFGFNIPSNAIVQGILVHAWKLSPNSVEDTSVVLFVNGASSGTDKANLLVDWPSTITASPYGSATDLWGIGTSPSIFNNSQFGIGMAIQKDGTGTQTGEVDAFDITVFAVIPTTIYGATIRNGTLR